MILYNTDCGVRLHMTKNRKLPQLVLLKIAKKGVRVIQRQNLPQKL